MTSAALADALSTLEVGEGKLEDALDEITSRVVRLAL